VTRPLQQARKSPKRLDCLAARRFDFQANNDNKNAWPT
jgi:hypothetical protein